MPIPARPVPSHRPHAPCALPLSRTRRAYFPRAQKPPGKTRVTRWPIQPCHERRVSPPAAPLLAWPGPAPGPCKPPLVALVPPQAPRNKAVPAALLGRKRASDFCTRYLPSPEPGRGLWVWNRRAEKNEHCITAAVNTDSFWFLQHFQYRDTVKPVPNQGRQSLLVFLWFFPSERKKRQRNRSGLSSCWPHRRRHEGSCCCRTADRQHVRSLT